MGRTCAKNGQRQSVIKSMESRRGWQKKKRKTKAAMERLCQTRYGKGRYEQPRVEDHRRRQREINNESRRSNQVTWTPPRKGSRGRRRRSKAAFGVRATSHPHLHFDGNILQRQQLALHLSVIQPDLRLVDARLRVLVRISDAPPRPARNAATDVLCRKALLLPAVQAAAEDRHGRSCRRPVSVAVDDAPGDVLYEVVNDRHDLRARVVLAEQY